MIKGNQRRTRSASLQIVPWEHVAEYPGSSWSGDMSWQIGCCSYSSHSSGRGRASEASAASLCN